LSSISQQTFEEMKQKEIENQMKSLKRQQGDELDEMTSKWGFGSRMMSKPIVPTFQQSNRDPSQLFVHPDRMELLQTARSIEKAAAKTVTTNLEISGSNVGRTLARLSSNVESKEVSVDKMTKVISEPYLREMTIRSANRKKRELQEERKKMEEKKAEDGLGAVTPPEEMEGEEEHRQDEGQNDVELENENVE
jgi:hypothetical protein